MEADFSAVLGLSLELWRQYHSSHFGFDKVSSVASDISQSFMFQSLVYLLSISHISDTKAQARSSPLYFSQLFGYRSYK